MNSIPKNSLQILPKDNRDFNLGAISIQPDVKDIPNANFTVASPLIIKDQKDSDYCSAYAVTAVSEDHEGIELLPEYQFYKTKVISKKPEEWGANLRDACKSAVNYGSIPRKDFKIADEFSRYKVLQKETWPDDLDEVAKLYKKQTFFAVDGRYDTFDNIRTRLWQYRNKKCTVVTGSFWRNEWINSPDGIINKPYGNDGFGHAFKIFGQKVIKGEIYLMAQLSQGDRVGDRGIFYFSREITNKEIGSYGIYMFLDISREEAESYINHPKSFFSTFLKYLQNFFLTENKPSNMKTQTLQEKNMFLRNLNKGMYGRDVNRLQEKLKDFGYLEIEKTTDFYGNATADAVRKFQISINLIPDGIFGAKTRYALNSFKPTLEEAIMQVESGGDLNAIGDKNLKDKAYGCMQIRQPCVDDVNKRLGTKYKSEDTLGNRALSILIFREYQRIYNPNGTDEEKARTWNGGPGWKRNPKLTDPYWSKIKKLLS